MDYTFGNSVSCAILIPFFVLVYLNQASCQCFDEQRVSLLQLKRSFTNSSSSSPRLASWRTETNCCSWEGVSCDEHTGDVIGLDLSNSSISGQIGSSLFNLRHLRRLNLAYNMMRPSPIPSGFDRLPNLTHLNLSTSRFYGQIPQEISRLTRLVSLDLSTQQNYYFSSLVDDNLSFDPTLLDKGPLKLENPDLGLLVQNLTNLRELYLDGVNISAQGNKWGQTLSTLSNLQKLSLSECYLSGPIDSSLLYLQSLSHLRLDNNNLSSVVPSFLGNFSSLALLSLLSCELHGEFPRDVFWLPSMQNLDVSNNPLLTGNLPEFPSSSGIQFLSLSQTKFSGKLPDSIGNLKFLTSLMLSNCEFSGAIPHSISNLTQLTYLDLSWNNFSGQIPSLDLCKGLVVIEISNNNLTGPIPSFLWNELLNLTQLDLRNNSLVGRVPSSVFRHPSLKWLDLSINQFSGQLNEFPNPFSSLLEMLDLSDNEFLGPLPRSVLELPRLQYLFLSSNNFNGTVELHTLENLKYLTDLDLSDNNLSISIPRETTAFSSSQISSLQMRSCNINQFPGFLKNLKQLTVLDISNNRIPGKIPNWLWTENMYFLNLSCNLLEGFEQPLPGLSTRFLAFLDLHSNLLQGPLPVPLPTAVFTDYSDNKFVSFIPDEIDISSSISLSLSRNNLTGKIPPSICNPNVTSLRLLDLSNNYFTGQIPQCLGEMTSELMVLNLGRNDFHGTIPPIFKEGCNLRTLDLNGNQLEGQLPRTLANCKALEVLNLGNNHITDTFPFWLEPLSQLGVLLLQSNSFHGPIRNPPQTHPTLFPELQIIDLSSNSFTGNLPAEFFKSWTWMMKGENIVGDLMPSIRGVEVGDGDKYYQDTVTVTNKGQEMELVKIFTVFTAVDLSNNRFQGQIPEMIGDLKFLHALNISGNSFTGPIPVSLGYLTLLESLDLSRNKLTGEIPWTLTKLTFLSVLNLSQNFLVGPIPQGSQFPTFPADAFSNNLGLCGPPLPRDCDSDAVGTAPEQEADVREPTNEFEWKLIWMGFPFGYVAGLSSSILTLAHSLASKGLTLENLHLLNRMKRAAAVEDLT